VKRVIFHWTAGGNTPSNLDKGHYHFLIDGAGNVHKGTHPVEANRKPVKGKYAAHTLNCNTGSIGVAVCAMAGAVERPFNAGSAPITPAQVKALAGLLRDLCAQYKIPVTRETVLSHAEVQPTLGIKQRGKWDIAWLPGMKGPGDPVAVGDKIRAMVKAPATAPQKPAQRESEAPAPEAAAKPGYRAGVAVGALAAAGGWAAAKWAEVTQAWADFWVWAFSWVS
jgi:hypothetical protein